MVYSSLRGFASVAAIALGMGLAAPVWADANNPVVAIVEGHEITRADLELVKASMAQSMPQLGMIPLEAVYDALLNQAVSRRLVIETARKEGLENSELVKAQMERALEEALQRSYIATVLEQRLTDELLQERYQAFLAENPVQEERNARHILVAEEELANDILKALQDGADFAAQAAEHSIDPGSRQRGGDLGWFRAGDMVEEFSTAAFALEEGQISPAPVQSAFGWHILKLDGVRNWQPPSFEDSAEMLRAEAAEDIIAEVLEQISESADVTLFNIDGSPR